MESTFNKTARFFFVQFTIVLLVSSFSSLYAQNVTILPGQSKTFRESVFNSDAISYSVTVIAFSFITFTDLGAQRLGSFLSLNFRLSVSFAAPGGTHEVRITYMFNAGFPFASFTYNVFIGFSSSVEEQKLDIPLEFSLNQN